MSSGTLPLDTYHRAQSVGSGTYGSVLTVYDDEGEEYALKLFVEDDDDEEDEETGYSLGALREISLLRLLRDGNSHPNIIEIHDVQTEFVDEGEAGAGTDGYLGVAMPLFAEGSLADSLGKISSKRQKLAIAHGILSAVAYLHENSIIHRDIKSDNILLAETRDKENNITYKPVLIDFSLAKVMDPNVIYGQSYASCISSTPETEPTHTSSVGTPTYRAPEVVQRKPYGLPSDLWSVGVVLLELLRGKCLEAMKDNSATRLISESLDTLPKDQPFPTLIRGLLQEDPDKRWTARQALDAEVFKKFGLVTDAATFSTINIKEAVPLEGEEDDNDDENRAVQSNNNKGKGKRQSPNKARRFDSKLVNRYRLIKKVCSHLEWNNPLTAQAALTYSIQMSELDDVDDLQESQALLDCVVLAHKFFEHDISDLNDLEDGGGGSLFKDWTVEQYVDSESTLFIMMDFCLYPRRLVDIPR